MVAAVFEEPRRRLTVDDVLAMVEAGILAEDEPVELLGGELVVMSPQGDPHAGVTSLLRRRLERTFEARCFGREHSPVRATEYDLPEPDIAIVRGAPHDYFDRTPRGADTVLVVEIAQTSQRRDRAKAVLYARGGFPVLWLIDLVRRTLTVYSEPVPDGYRRVVERGEGDSVVVPESAEVWPVAELLPPPPARP